MGFECSRCDPPRSFKTASGMVGHRRMKHEAMAHPSVDHPQDGETTSKAEQISDEELVALLGEHFEHLESKILSAWENLLDQSHHPAGFCKKYHCSEAKTIYDQAIVQATKNEIAQQAPHPAGFCSSGHCSEAQRAYNERMVFDTTRGNFEVLKKASENLHLEQQAMDLFNECLDLLEGQNYGSVFRVGPDRVHGQVGTFRELGTGNVFRYRI